MTEVSDRRDTSGGITGDRSGWFATLFMTDVWERFAFYSVQSLLVLFAAASTEAGGFGLSTANAAALTGSWIGLTYMLGGPGGWAADRLLGVRRGMQTGGLIIALGHFGLVVPVPAVNAVALVLVAVGAGLYKPNHQALINLMYGTSGRREAGISLLYMGIQISALIAPLVVGVVSQVAGYHPAFAISGLVMLGGVVQFSLSSRRFADVGSAPGRPLEARERRVLIRWCWIGAPVLAAVVVAAVLGGLWVLLTVYLIASVAAPLAVRRALRRRPELGADDRRRLRTFSWALLVWTVFFMIISQGGSVVLLFAEQHVDRRLLGMEIPTSWFTAVSPAFLLCLSPVFAWLLPRLRGGMPGKFALALGLGGISFLLLAIPASAAAAGPKVSPLWVLAVYLLHSCGELIIIAVAVAAASDVLPRTFISQMIGLLWLFAALGGGLGSQIVLLAQALPAYVYFCGYGVFALLLAGVILLRGPVIRRVLRPPGEVAPAS